MDDKTQEPLLCRKLLATKRAFRMLFNYPVPRIKHDLM